MEVDIKFELFVFVSKKKNFDNFFISILNTFKKFLCFFVWIFFIHLPFFLCSEKEVKEKRDQKRKKEKKTKENSGRDFFSFF